MGATSLSLIRSTAASVLPGGVGTAVGMFVAYPIDVLKTKAQVVRKGEQQKQTDLLSRAKSIYRDEGIHGFFGGVLATIIGKAMTSYIIWIESIWDQFSQWQSISWEVVMRAVLHLS